MNTPLVIDALQSIPKFCKDNGISRAFFYKLRADSKGPKVTKLGSRSVITPKSRKDWLDSLDQEADV